MFSCPFWEMSQLLFQVTSTTHPLSHTAASYGCEPKPEKMVNLSYLYVPFASIGSSKTVSLSRIICIFEKIDGYDRCEEGLTSKTEFFMCTLLFDLGSSQ